MIRINRLFVLFFVCSMSHAAINPMNYPPPVRQKLIELKEQCILEADPTNKRPVYLEDSAVQKADLNGDGIQDFIVHESSYIYGGRFCGSVFGNSNGSIYIAVSGRNGIFKEAYAAHKGRHGDIQIDYRSKPNKITMELDNVFGSEQCGKDIKSNASATICNRTLLWNPVTKRLDLGPITFTPQQRRINSSNDLEFQKSQQRSRTSATVNNFNPKSDADYRNTGIPYQYRELSEPTDSLLSKVGDWFDQYDSVEKLGALGKISSQTVDKGNRNDGFLYGDQGTVEVHDIKYDDGMDINYMVVKNSDRVWTHFFAINSIVSSDLIQRLTGFKIGQKMVDIRNKLGMPHMITRGKNPNERVYFYSAGIHDNRIGFGLLGVRGNEISSYYTADFYRTKDERLALARRSQLSNFSAVYDENYKNPLRYGDEYEVSFDPSFQRVSFSFDENNLLKQVSFDFNLP